ncbi:MAG: zinc ribbon domain-containing protein, partial [Acidimicrobiales bacterium]
MPPPELESLLAVGSADTSLAQLRHRRATLPERAELAEMAVQRRAIEKRRSLVEAELGSVRLRQSNLEGRLEASTARAEQINRRVYGGEVSATRELQVMLAEVEQLKSRASQLEDEVLAVMEEGEPIAASVDAMNEEVAALGVRRTKAEAVLFASEAELDAEIVATQADRDRAAEAVPPALLADYEALSRR